MTSLTTPDRKSRERPQWVAIVRGIFVGAALIALGAYIWQDREAMSTAIGELSPLPLLFAGVMAAGFTVTSCAAWRLLVTRNDKSITVAEASRIYFLGQLGKYLPGGVWQFFAAAELGRDAGLPRLQIVSSFAFALAASLAAGSVVVLAALPEALPMLGLQPRMALLAAALILAALLHPAAHRIIARIIRTENAPQGQRLALSVTVSLGTWLFGGLHLWFLASALGQSLSFADMLPLAGCFAAAWIAGFLVMIAPAGVGAREATLILLLSQTMSIAEAATIAIGSRLLMTLADVGAAGLAMAFTHSPTSPAGAPRPLRD
ncbi:lysylphosphatidylglycerol synthase transmembrane domain-containing protein [Erythrobacter alti]|uniref:lysylphosphatidylglycerol synthase transmembrane domain-containing protein n=1 Tax=Erythrobacter alti TaxID=1896145 RepID=UPI0030F3D682